MREDKRWFSPLLQHASGTTVFIRKTFPNAIFRVEKQVVRPKKIMRHVNFEVGDRTLVHAISEIDVENTHPEILKHLKAGKLPIGEIVLNYNVRRTRLRATSRTREFHFHGDLNARVWERFYVTKKK